MMTLPPPPPTRSQAIRPRAPLSQHHQSRLPLSLSLSSLDERKGNQNHLEVVVYSQEQEMLRSVIFLFFTLFSEAPVAELFSGCPGISVVLSDEKERFSPLQIMEMIIICIENSN